MAGLPFASNQQPLKYSTPQVNSYEARKVNIGRITTQVDGGPAQVSALGGLEGLAKGLDKWADVLEQQEKDKQTIEAIKETKEFRDRERLMLDEMEQMQGEDAEAAAAFAEAFYERENKDLIGKARGNFQRMIYEKTVNSDREVGLNRAFAHHRAEFKRFEESVILGDQAQYLETASDWRSTPEDIERASGEFMQRQAAYYQRQGLDPRAADIKARQLVRDALRQNTTGRIAQAIKVGDVDKAEELFESLKGETQSGASMVAGARFALPTDNHHHITSPFGPRSAPKTPQGMGSTDHKGIDLRMPVGTPVKAVSGGTISFAGDKGDYGVAVIIKHDDGTTTSQYGHLSKLGVKPGDRVKAGDVIALSGNTGKSSGPHLDLKVTENGKYIDPAPLLGLTREGLSGPKETADLGGLFSPAEIEEMRLQVVQARDDQSVKNTTAGIANAFQNGTELEIASSINKGFSEINKLGDPDRQNSMRKGLLQNIEFQQTVRDAADMETTENFLAETEGLSPLERKKKLQEWDGFSRKARETLAKQIDEGTINKVTYENQGAYDQIRVAIDARQNGNNPMTEQEVKAMAMQYGLTVTQAKGAEEYRAQGGMAGVSGFAGKVTALYKELGRGSENAPGGFMELVARNLPPGKTATPEELRRVVATLMISGIKGESIDAGFLYWDTSETYDQAAKKGRANAWLPKVDDEEKAALTLEINAKIEAGEFPDKPIKDEDIRDYKRVFKMGLPPRLPKKLAETQTSLVHPF